MYHGDQLTTPVENLITNFGISFNRFADDTQLYQVKSIKLLPSSSLAALSTYADAITNWQIRNRWLLNSVKIETPVTGTRQ